jgi:hypothetical protein
MPPSYIYYSSPSRQFEVYHIAIAFLNQFFVSVSACAHVSISTGSWAENTSEYQAPGKTTC